MNGFRDWLKVVVIMTITTLIGISLIIAVIAQGKFLEQRYWTQDFVVRPGWIIKSNNIDPISISLLGSSYFKLIRNGSEPIESMAVEPTDFYGATYYTLDARLNQTWTLISDSSVEGTLKGGGSILIYPSDEKFNQILKKYSRYGFIFWLCGITGSLIIINLMNRNPRKSRRFVPSEL